MKLSGIRDHFLATTQGHYSNFEKGITKNISKQLAQRPFPSPPQRTSLFIVMGIYSLIVFYFFRRIK